MRTAERKTRLFALLTALWLVFIFLLSAQDATKSSDFSDAFTRLILNFLEPGEHTEEASLTETEAGFSEAAMPDASGSAGKSDAAQAFANNSNSDTYDPVPNRDWFGIAPVFFKSFVRKTAHFFMFCGLGFLAVCTLRSYYGKPHIRVYASAWLFCVFCAVCDEFHQLFVPGRGAQLSDVCLDSAGALTGVAIAFLVLLLRKGLQKRKKRNHPKTIS